MVVQVVQTCLVVWTNYCLELCISLEKAVARKFEEVVEGGDEGIWVVKKEPEPNLGQVKFRFKKFDIGKV